MKRTKAVAVAVAVAAGVLAATAPAEASECKRGGGRYICEYGVTTKDLPNGERQEFIVGTNQAVWTRWTEPDRGWNRWQSMGGYAKSKVTVTDHWSFGDPWAFTLIVKGKDDWLWVNHRSHEGDWSGWQHHPGPD